MVFLLCTTIPHWFLMKFSFKVINAIVDQCKAEQNLVNWHDKAVDLKPISTTEYVNYWKFISVLLLSRAFGKLLFFWKIWILYLVKASWNAPEGERTPFS